MRRKIWIITALFLVLPGLLLTASCAKKALQDSGAMTDEGAKTVEKADDTQKADASKDDKDKSGVDEGDLERQKELLKQRFLNEHVYFDFDKYDLKPSAVENLKFKTKWLMDNPGVSVMVEGHCDERGTEEYNLALGDRRANSIKTFLVQSGITEARITAISYGEEKPLDPAKNETAWAKNRRGQLKIK